MKEISPVQSPTPASPPTQDEDIARRAFLALDALDCGSRRKLPTLLTIFRLYCIEELTIVQIAKKCRCSIGTVANRLKLLETTTGAKPEALRKVSPYIAKFHRDQSNAAVEYLRRTNQT